MQQTSDIQIPPDTQRQLLRLHMRERRRKLSEQDQRQASNGLITTIARQPWLYTCRHIALYWPNDGEINPLPLAQLAWRAGIQCFLPVLHPWRHRRLWFAPFTAKTRFHPNRFGIPEPNRHKNAPITTRHLDVVLLPLVAFDRAGGRLGMGGGFYDATFAGSKRLPGATKPKLIGLAHSCQEVAQLELAGWDIPLDGIATEREYIRVSRGQLRK